MRRAIASLFERAASLLGRLRTRTGTLRLIACVCTVLVGMEAWQLWRVYDHNLQHNDAMTSLSAHSISERVQALLEAADTIAARLAERVEAEGTAPDAVRRLLALMTSLAAALPAVHEMGISDAKGNAIVKALVSHPTGMNYADRESFQFHAAHQDRTAFTSTRIRSKLDGTRIIAVTRRINRPDGSFDGVVAVSLSVQFFQDLIDEMQAQSGGVIGLTTEDGRVLVRSPAVPEDSQLFLGGQQLHRQLLQHPAADGYTYVSAIDGVQRRGSYRHLDQYPLVTLVSQSEPELQAAWRRELRSHAVILAGATAVLALLGTHAIRSTRRLRAQVMQDALTGLANRRYFDETMEREFRRACRKGQPLAVIMVDVDHFKDYNDTYGHIAGDECLRALARAIQGCLRRAGDFAARYGGEEIVVVLPDANGPQATAVAGKMQAAVRALALRHEHNGPGVVSFSGGVAACVPQGRSGGWQTLVAQADAALYAAKAKGRDLVETC